MKKLNASNLEGIQGGYALTNVTLDGQKAVLQLNCSNSPGGFVINKNGANGGRSVIHLTGQLGGVTLIDAGFTVCFVMFCVNPGPPAVGLIPC